MIDEFHQRRNAGIRTVDSVDDQRLILGDRLTDYLAAHQFAAGDLPLLKRDGEVDVRVLENMADGEIVPSIDAAYQRVEIGDFLLRRDALLSPGAPHMRFARLKALNQVSICSGTEQ